MIILSEFTNTQEIQSIKRLQLLFEIKQLEVEQKQAELNLIVFDLENEKGKQQPQLEFDKQTQPIQRENSYLNLHDEPLKEFITNETINQQEQQQEETKTQTVNLDFTDPTPIVKQQPTFNINRDKLKALTGK